MLGGDDEGDNTWSRRGTIVHAYLRIVHQVGQRAALEAIAAEYGLAADSDEIRFCEVIDLDLIPRGGTLEATYAWSAKGGARYIGRDLERDYTAAGVTTDEWPGTFDYVAVLDAAALVHDYKTGARVVSELESWQLALGMLCVCRVHRLTQGKAAHIKIQEDGRPRWYVREFDQFDLDAIERRMVKLDDEYRRMEEMSEEQRLRLGVSAGEWCTYCPRYLRCPLKVGALAALGRGEAEELNTEVTGADAARALETLLRFEEASKAAWAQLFAYAELHPIRLPDGRVFGPKEGEARDSVLDHHKALALVREQMGEKYALLATRTTKGDLENAAKQWARDNGHPIGKSAEALIIHLRDRQLIEKKPGEIKPRLYKPAPQITEDGYAGPLKPKKARKARSA